MIVLVIMGFILCTAGGSIIYRCEGVGRLNSALKSIFFNMKPEVVFLAQDPRSLSHCFMMSIPVLIFWIKQATHMGLPPL